MADDQLSRPPPTDNTSYPAAHPVSPRPPLTLTNAAPSASSAPAPHSAPPRDSRSRSLKRARSSSSPDQDKQNGGPAQLHIHKRRAQPRPDTNALNILADAATSRPRAPVPLTISNSRRRILLNSPSPFPSPLSAEETQPFNLLTRLLSHIDILLEVSSYIPPTTLLNLYSISAPFHYLMDSHFTAFMLSSTSVWAPSAELIFPWWCFRQLCIEDPGLRGGRTIVETRSLSWTDRHGTPHSTIWKALESADKDKRETLKKTFEGDRKVSNEHMKAVSGKGVYVKAVPSFRWLKMVVWREMVSREIVGWMAAHGHRLVRDETVEAVKKMWFLMDMPVNAPRIALIHNTAYFTPKTLFMLQTLFIKLDMLYTDPVHSHGGEHTIRQMLLAERNPVTLWDYLRGADGASRLDVMRLWLKHGYRRMRVLGPMTKDGQYEWDRKVEMDILGVPAKLVGRWGFECWGLGTQRLLRPDELVQREGVRRRLDMQRMYLRMIASGHLTEGLTQKDDAVADWVVLSLIRRRRNREREVRERRARGEDVDMEDDESGYETSEWGYAAYDDALGSLQSSVMQLAV